MSLSFALFILVPLLLLTRQWPIVVIFGSISCVTILCVTTVHGWRVWGFAGTLWKTSWAFEGKAKAFSGVVI
jgi:hypothetical protein